MADTRGKNKLTPLFWRQLLWKVTIIGLILVILAEIGYIWIKGGEETTDAFNSGRRLLITLETGEVDGKIISSNSETESKKSDKETTDQKEPAKDTESTPDVGKQAAPDAQPATEEKSATDTKGTETKDASQPPPEGEVVNTLNTIADEKEADLQPIVPSKNPPAAFSSTVSEKTEFGTLPKIASNGTKPWKYYSKTITINDKKPMIAIIITGLGQNRNIGEQALRLPEEMNLSFSPYSSDLNSWMLSARLSGHEVLIDLPMEAANYPVSDPGPLGLLVSKEQGENETKIKKLMAHDAGYIGFLTPQDESFLENNELFKSLLNVIAGRGLVLVVGKQPPKNETREMIEKGNTASVIVDTLIDEELLPTAIQARLSLLEQTAKQRGYAIGVAHGYPITIKHLNEWTAKAAENGFVLVPVSTIISKHY